DQLVGGTRAKPLAFRAPDIGIVELALEPQLRRQRASLAGLHPHLQRTPAAVIAHSLDPARGPRRRGPRPRPPASSAPACPRAGRGRRPAAAGTERRGGWR